MPLLQRLLADVDDHHKKNRKQIRESLFTFKDLAALILDDEVDDACLRQELFKKIDKNDLSDQIEAVDVWLTGKYSHAFNLVTKRFSYIRQFSPALVRHLNIIAEDNGRSDLPAAINLLNALNEENKRKLPEDAPIGFIPQKIRPLDWIVDQWGRMGHFYASLDRVILECDPIGNGIDIQLIEHISPVTWDNVILYGEYVIDEKLVRV